MWFLWHLTTAGTGQDRNLSTRYLYSGTSSIVSEVHSKHLQASYSPSVFVSLYHCNKSNDQKQLWEVNNYFSLYFHRIISHWGKLIKKLKTVAYRQGCLPLHSALLWPRFSLTANEAEHGLWRMVAGLWSTHWPSFRCSPSTQVYP